LGAVDGAASGVRAAPVVPWPDLAVVVVDVIVRVHVVMLGVVVIGVGSLYPGCW
jgi:hypothetical protein